jgi:hypothetical protein
MEPPGARCLLPDWYDRASPEDQAALELNCDLVNGERMQQVLRKHGALVEWIKAGRSASR